MRPKTLFGGNESPNLVPQAARPFFNDQLNRGGREQVKPDARNPDPKASNEVEPEGLLDALEDISDSWMQGEPARIRTRFPKEGQVSLFEGEQFRHRMSAAELSRQVGEGVRMLKTASFTFEETVKLDHNRYFVAAKHRFTGQDEQPQQVYVSYVLQRKKDAWQIVEYGVSKKPITRHSAVPAQEEEFGPGWT